MNVTDQLKEIVDGVARSGALTPEAIRQFDELRTHAKGLEEAIASRTKERDAANQAVKENALALTETKNQLAAMTKRAQDAEAKIAQAEKAIYIAEFEKQARSEMRSILSDVFRNAEIQRTISHSQPVVVPPSYPGGTHQIQYTTDEKTETETRK